MAGTAAENRDTLALQEFERVYAHEPDVSGCIIEVAEQCGLGLAGFEHRVKGKELYLRKVRGMQNWDIAVNAVNDILRYTYLASPAEPVDRMKAAMEALAKKGYNTVGVINTWLQENTPLQRY